MTTSNKTDAYGRIAKWYDKIFASINTGLYIVGLKMYPPTDDMAVLDVGCGTGTQLAQYQKSGCQLFGIDMSTAMLDVARTKLGEQAELYLGDAAHMPYEDNTFDLVLSTLALHEMSPNLRSAILQEIKRVLKKDGRVLVIDFHSGPIKPFSGWLSKLFITMSEIGAGREHYKNYRQFMKNKGVPALADTHGFTVEKQRIVSGGNIGIFVLT